MKKLFVLLLGSVLWTAGAFTAVAASQPEEAAAIEEGEAIGERVGLYATLAEYEELTGERIRQFSEAPMLETKVAAGELPPLDERLPEEPMVIEPLERIGRYGGTMKLAGVGRENMEMGHLKRFLGHTSYDGKRMVPFLARGWEQAGDSMSLTLYLRKGLKWSDGARFTADDIVFWYEDIVLNKELSPAVPQKWAPGGVPLTLIKVDDYTLRFEFAVPYPRASMVVAAEGRRLQPEHYLRKYHIEYNADADKIAREEGHDHWWQALKSHTGSAVEWDTDLPSFNPWVLTRIDAGQNRYWERNAYYWMVDTAGNQLPYIDAIQYTAVATPELVALNAMEGELTSAVKGLSFSDFAVYKRNEESGGYKIHLFNTSKYYTGTALAYLFNYTHKDPVLKEIFNDLRFRQATSLAINREEISKTVFLGKNAPYTLPVPPTRTGYEDWMGTSYAEYDPARANELLDEMGLEWDQAHEFRLRPDGKPLHFLLEYSLEWLGAYPGQVLELIKEYWAEVGINVTPKYMTEKLIGERAAANEADTGIWATEFAGERRQWASYPIWVSPPWHWYPGLGAGGPEWRTWHETKGAQGEEPPAEIRRLFNLVDQWLASSYGSEEFATAGKEILTINAEGLYHIGTVGPAPRLVLRANNLRNSVRDQGHFIGWWTGVYIMEQWFLEE